LALHDDAVGCCCVEHGVVVVGEEGVVVAWADCRGGGCEEGRRKRRDERRVGKCIVPMILFGLVLYG
jgi:hypothetical protein